MKNIHKPAAIAVALFTASSALAADLPSRKAPVVAPPPPPMWSGFYVGLNAGGVWGNNAALNAQTWNLRERQEQLEAVSAALLSGSANTSGNAGFIGGGQIGYNWQVGNVGGMGFGSSFVTGIEADIQGVASSNGNRTRTSIGTATDGPSVARIISYQSGISNLQYLGTVRGRLGFLALPTLLIYGTGGLAYGGISANIQNVQFVQNAVNNAAVLTVLGSGNYSNTMVGWTAGGGLEWMFLPNWSTKVEYLYYDLGQANGSVVNTSVFNAGPTGIWSTTNFSGRATGNIVRAGVNYHFNWGAAPVVAKY